MSAPGLSMVLGSLRAWYVTGRGPQNQTVTGLTGEPDASLSAKVWPGGSRAVLFEPSVTWADAATCKVRLEVTPDQQAGASLAAGQYRVEVGVTPQSDGLYRVIYHNAITFEPTAGTAADPVAWVSYADLATWSSEISSLQDRDEDQTGFASQRAAATQQAVAAILRRYCPVPGQTRRLMDAAETAAGPYTAYDDTRTPPTKAQLKAWLADPARVIMSEDLTKAVSLIAAAMVYGSPGTNNPYAQQAAADRTEAMACLREAAVEVDAATVKTGVPTIRVTRNCTFLT